MGGERLHVEEEAIGVSLHSSSKKGDDQTMAQKDGFDFIVKGNGEVNEAQQLYAFNEDLNSRVFISVEDLSTSLRLILIRKWDRVELKIVVDLGFLWDRILGLFLLIKSVEKCAQKEF